MGESLHQLSTRLQGYDPIEVTIELAMIWVVVWLVFRFLHGTRAARMLKGLGVLLIVASLLILVLAREDAFRRIQFLYRGFLGFAAIALVVVFQPELRRALVRLGEARLFRSSVRQLDPVIDAIVQAVTYLSKNKIGAIMAIEREVPLGGIIEAGTGVDAEVSPDLLQTIFWPGSALHDMGVVIRKDRIAAAGVQFPLAEGEEISQELGSRHRAALGLSAEADCLVVVVSEETGAISLAERGQLVRRLSPEALRSMLRTGLSSTAAEVAIDPDEDLLEKDKHTASEREQHRKGERKKRSARTDDSDKSAA